jgi:hypothetical protein
MNDISKASPKGMRMTFARIRAAKRAITVAMAKKSF